MHEWEGCSGRGVVGGGVVRVRGRMSGRMSEKVSRTGRVSGRVRVSEWVSG